MAEAEPLMAEDEEARITIVKADGGKTIPEGQADTSKSDPFQSATIVQPLIDPFKLLELFESSDGLRPNVDTLAHNIAGIGWQLLPNIDFSKETASDEVAAALYLQDAVRFRKELEAAGEENRAKVKPIQVPADEEVESTKKEWERQARFERIELEVWLESLCIECPLSELIRRTVIDREVVGWGAWEMIRLDGRLVRSKQVEAHTLRLGPISEEPVEVVIMQPTSKVTTMPQKVEVFFRIIVQLVGLELIYFKQYGDPRTVSAQTGMVFEDEGAMLKQEPETVAASEIWWFPLPFPNTPYGMPRWHGMIPGIKGSRLAQDLTVVDLQSSSIPRGMILAMDTRLGKDVTGQIKAFFNSHKGVARNRIAIIEAQTMKQKLVDGAGRAQLEWIPLVEAQYRDAQFQWYVERTQEAVGQQFRIPKILSGQMKDFNRSTALAALDYAEEQIFKPERNTLSWEFTRGLLRSRGVRFWSFSLKGPQTSDKSAIADAVDTFVKNGVITPLEARPVAEKTLGLELPEQAGDWQRQPLQMTLAGFDPTPGAETQTEDEELAKDVGARTWREGNNMLLDGQRATDSVPDSE